MPDQMLRYRAAAWLIRTTAPEISMGLPTADETIDVEGNVSEILDDAVTTIEHNANTETLDIDNEPTFIDAETGEVLNSETMFK